MSAVSLAGAQAAPRLEYDTGGFYDEMFDEAGNPRPGAEAVIARLAGLSRDELVRRQAAAETLLLNLGITFSVYGNPEAGERIFPFDIIPRIVPASEFAHIEAGLQQRVRALNMFIDDVYRDRRILRDGVVPADIVMSGRGYLPQCAGLDPPLGIWCHIVGSDLVRESGGEYHVLEDNLRCPSGVSYVLENRQVLKRTFPLVFSARRVRPVDDFPGRLLALLEIMAPWAREPTAVVLTPGIVNSAYFEHSFLARQMGIELVEGRDLTVSGERVLMRTTKGYQPVDVIYRRIDDTFLDPLAFHSDSVLGVPGLFEAYRAGNVAIVNAPGTGVADDKVIYSFVPEMIRYYLSEEPVIPNVETFICVDPKQRAHVTANLDKLVVKAANESGGHGMLIGPHSTQAERQEFKARIEADPRNYIAQPTVALSRSPVIVEDHLEGRHVDLRPFVLLGDGAWVLPGGLTRVALKKGSLVVNSSQGGGSKDTWVLAE